MSKPQIIFVVGGPGAGKGTQCKLLKDQLNFATFSTGDILRQVVREQKAEGWQQLDEDMKQGKLISSSRLLGFLKTILLNSANKKILLDGFPRNQENIDCWKETMREDVELKGVLYFDCSPEEMKRRVLGRKEGRADDNEKTIKKRLSTFERETRPLLPQFKEMPNFMRIDCNKTPDKIFLDIKKLLRENKLIKEGKTIYDDKEHLKQLVKEIVTLHRDDGYENFEEVSMFVREKNTKLDNFQYKLPLKTVNKCFEHTKIEENVLTNFALKKKKMAKTINNYMDDVLYLSKLFEWGGISFSDDEWYKIRMAMKKILSENDCEYLRFFGKIYGIDSDYYVIQGILKTYPMRNPPKHEETRGNEGINRYTFWVSNSILESWYELPDITHDQIVASRKFKYHFTGDLNSKVKSFVSFPGKEMHLLKCQIIRILHSSAIVPKGYYKISENFKEQLEGKVTELDEEFKSPTFEEMKAPEGEAWIHEHAYIYPNGKVIDPSIETQVDRLKGINEDEGYKIKEGEGENVTEIDQKYWKVKVVGDQIMHNRPNGDPVTHAVVLVRNTRWPGTLTVWKEEKFANIYVGYGIKATDSNYYPTQLAKIDKDPADMEEQKEPFPEKEPVKPEEKKEGEEGEGEGGEKQDEPPAEE